MLAYCSVLHEGYAAGPDTPGVAPMRATACFEPVDYQPGVPPRVITTPNEQDLADLVADVRAAKEQADTVVLSLHWGVHFVPRVTASVISSCRRRRKSPAAPARFSATTRPARPRVSQYAPYRGWEAQSSRQAVISRDGIRTSFLPTLIDTQLRPEILHPGDPPFDDMVRYMECASEGFTRHFAIDGDGIAISG